MTDTVPRRGPSLIQFLLIAFPLGLILLGTGSLMWTHFRPQETPPVDQNESKRLDAASLNRRPVSRADLQSYTQVLGDQIGERHTGIPAGLEKTAVWIESMLGPGNFGYFVERQTFELDDQSVRNLIAELPGKRRRQEIVVISVHYDTVTGNSGRHHNGTGIAALLSLAQAFAGDQQDRTIRFIAFVNGESPWHMGKQMGSLRYAQRSRELNENIVAVLSLEGLGFYAAGTSSAPAQLVSQLPDQDGYLAFVGNESSRFIGDAARVAFARGSAIPVHTVSGPEDIPFIALSDPPAFWKHGYAAVRLTDTMPFRSPVYHQPEESAAALDFDQLTSAVSGIKAVIEEWANP